MNVTVTRAPGDKTYPSEIVDPLLVDAEACRQRGIAEINANSTSRKELSGNGPKNSLMEPTKLVEVIKRGESKRGILKLYSRSYNREKNSYTIDSSFVVEVQV